MIEANGLDKLNNFILRVWDEKKQEYRPVYIAPDATDKVQGDVFLTDKADDSLDAESGMTAITPKALKMIQDRIKIVTQSDDGLIAKLPGDDRLVFNGMGEWDEVHGQGRLYMFEVDEYGDLWQLYYDENEMDDFQLTDEKDLYAVYDDENRLLLGNVMGPQGPEGPPGPQGPKGDPGDKLNVLDSYNSLEELQAAHPDGSENAGDAYLVEDHYYLWNGEEWKDAGQLQGAEGPEGPPGPQGEQGTSYYFAFEVENGNLYLSYDETTIEPPDVAIEDGQLMLTVEDQKVSLGNVRGDRGPQGPEGPQGKQGLQGNPGDSLKLLDVYDSYSTFTSEHPTGDNIGDAYLVEGRYYFWNGQKWNDGGKLSDPTIESISIEEIDDLMSKV